MTDERDSSMEREETDTDAEAVIEVVERLSKVETLNVGDGRLVLAVPNGKRLEPVKQYLDAYLPRPERATGTASFSRLDSLIAHAKRHRVSESVLFCDERAPKLVVVYNGHHEARDDGAGNAGFGDFRAVYSFPLSEQWQAWQRAATSSMSLAEFAEFLEDRIIDVLDPADAGDVAAEMAKKLGITYASPSALMALSRGLSVHVKHKVAEHRNLSTGEAQLQFTEEHTDTAGNQLKVPGGFVISIPVFHHGPRYRLPVRLRYRVHGGQTTWFLAPHGADLAREDALDESVNRAAQETELPVFYGTPQGRE